MFKGHTCIPVGKLIAQAGDDTIATAVALKKRARTHTRADACTQTHAFVAVKCAFFHVWRESVK